MSMGGDKGAKKAKVVHHVVAAAMLMLVINMESETSWANGQQSLGQCLGKCGQDAFSCFTGCASDSQQDLISCIGCLSTCSATSSPTPTLTPPAPPTPPPQAPNKTETSLHY